MELLEKIEIILAKYDELEKAIGELDEMCDKISEEQSDTDKLLSDYYHIIENEELSDTAMVKICKQIHDVRKLRREYDFKNTVKSTYKKNKNKLIIAPKSTRAMFKNSINQAVKDFPTDYHFRVLSEEQVKDIIEERDKTEQMLEEIEKKELPVKEIAKKYGVSVPLVYYYARKIKKKEENDRDSE